MLRHSVSHFPQNCGVAELYAALCLDTRAKISSFNIYLNLYFHLWIHFVPLHHDCVNDNKIQALNLTWLFFTKIKYQPNSPVPAGRIHELANITKALSKKLARAI